MKNQHAQRLSLTLTLQVLLLPCIATAASEPRAQVHAAEDELEVEADELSDTSLAPYRERMLELAFNAVSKMPLEPHIKNRSRAQEAVLETCFELGQHERALRYAERIADWRRGSAYADYVFHCAKDGVEVDAERYLSLAARVASTDETARTQTWRVDQIRSKIARAWILLGNTSEAARFTADLVASEAGRVHVADAMVIDPEQLDARLATARAIFATGDFDQMRAMLDVCAELYERFHADEERSASALATIRSLWAKLPTSARVELALDLAARALRNGDLTEGLALVEEAQAMVDGARWTNEDLIPLHARLARLRHLAGDEARARADLDAALALYEAERERITDIYRADTLRPIAEAYHAMGAAAAALEVYRKAILAGSQNPNSRPRADDLSETLCSMARNAVEPDEALWERIVKIEAALKDPW